MSIRAAVLYTVAMDAKVISADARLSRRFKRRALREFDAAVDVYPLGPRLLED